MRRIAITLFASTLAAAGCANGTDFGGATCAATLSPTADTEQNRLAIQTAIGSAAAGSVICFNSGAYPLHDEIDVSTANIELRGPSSGAAAVLDFKGQMSGANGVSVVSADGFKITNLTVKNSPGDAVKVTQSKGVTFSGVTVTTDAGPNALNGAYGLYPVQCQNVLIDHCTVSYCSDAGIYVGQSQNVLVRNSEAFGNVAGIEIENTTDAEVVNNYSHDNTGGVLVFALPNLNMEGSARAKVHGNRILNNNGKNYGSQASPVHIVPSGTGVLVSSSKNNEVFDNDVNDNASAGIAIISYLISQMTWMDANYDPYPETNYVHDNRLSNNGTAPDGLAFQITLGVAAATGKPPGPVPDLVWDGLVDPMKTNTNNALTNCFQNNGSATYMDLGIDDMAKFHPSTDLGPVNCAHDPLPSINL